MTPRVVLDSGAFSAWTLGVNIGLDDYIQYVKANEHLLAGGYINLDVIPGRDRQHEWRWEVIDQAAQLSYLNWRKMLDAGLNPMPVVHMGDSFRHLERYVADGAGYIALSPHRGDRLSIIQWLDRCFNLLSDGNGRPLVKLHGLATTSTIMMLRYPWSSTDSSRFVHLNGNREILVPRYRNGAPDYNLQPLTVAVSERRRYGRRKHIDRLGSFERDCLHAFLTEELGMDIEQMRQDRTGAILTYFAKLEETCRQRHGTTFRIYQVSIAGPHFRQIFERWRVDHHLLSYAKLKDSRPTTLRDYIHGYEMCSAD